MITKVSYSTNEDQKLELLQKDDDITAKQDHLLANVKVHRCTFILAARSTDIFLARNTPGSCELLASEMHSLN